MVFEINSLDNIIVKYKHNLIELSKNDVVNIMIQKLCLDTERNNFIND